MRKSVVLVCVVTALTWYGSLTAHALDLGKIMPMGDSITAGYYVSGGYRDPLYTLLHNEGKTFQFVGTNSEWPTSTLTTAGQQYHEGHSGFIIKGGSGAPRSGLDENLAGWIGPGHATPDRILLMIGTNDMDVSYDVANAPARLSGLLTDIHAYLPNVNVYVASVTPSTTAAVEQRIATYNAAIPGVVANHRALGENVFFVNMHDALNATTDLADWLHPNASGYQKMGQAWDTAINASVVPEPGTVAMLITGLLGLMGYAWRRRKPTA